MRRKVCALASFVCVLTAADGLATCALLTPLLAQATDDDPPPYRDSARYGDRGADHDRPVRILALRRFRPAL
jgi:hypothetical protein